MTARQLITRLALVAVAGLGLFSMYRIGLLDLSHVQPAAENLAEFAGALFPPNTDVLGTLVDAMLETIEIAFVGTLVGALISLPLAFLSARTLFPPPVSVTTRMLIGAIRTVPSLLWGVIFVIAYGLGPEAGTLGVALYTVGFLAKLYSESFEAVDPEVVEAVQGAGSNRLQLIVYAVLPESANALVSHLLFMFEYNIRASTIMGFVGAGGIGYYMLGYVQLLQYENLMMALIVTFVVVMAVDYLSARLRVLIVPAMQGRRVRAPLFAGITTLAS
jgi:phosphonate transport system permease protein